MAGKNSKKSKNRLYKMKIKKWLRDKIKSKLSLWDIEDLQIGGHCGLCGNWISNTIVDKLWAVDMCDNCAGFTHNNRDWIKFRDYLKEK